MIRAALFSALLAASILAAPAAADSSFAGAVSGYPLIVLARVTVRSDGGITLHVEQVLKGHAGETLRFPASASAVEAGWARAVVGVRGPVDHRQRRHIRVARHRLWRSGPRAPRAVPRHPADAGRHARLVRPHARNRRRPCPRLATRRPPTGGLRSCSLRGGLVALAGAVRYRRRSDDRRFR